MIVARAPLRFSLGGGGTDLPAYASQHGGYCIAAAIDKYVYVALNPRFDSHSIRVAYANTEIVTNLDDMKHGLFRECLRLVGVRGGVELASMADAPANSGLGSSSAFTVACLAALHAYKGESASPGKLAHEACTVEIGMLGEPIGKQDQCIAAHGGVCELAFPTSGPECAIDIGVPRERLEALGHRLVVFYTGIERRASTVLARQKDAILSGAALERMHAIKAMGRRTREILLGGDLDEYGELLHQHWTAKRAVAAGMTNQAVDDHYDAAMDAGAIGGKLMGAGGGGFLLFYVQPEWRADLVAVMEERGLQQLHYQLGAPGVRVIHQT